MATPRWIGNAVNVPQIVSRTFADTWATADTATVTINGKDMVVALGTTETPAGIAAAVAAAFNLSTRLTAATGPGDGSTSNVGGQSIPEFAEITASVSSATVTFTAKTAGFPFTLSVTVDTAGDGSVGSETVVQAATGKNHWDNADNWDTGSVPDNDDTAIFRDSAIDCLYGLPNGSLEVTILVYASFIGSVGLPEVRGVGANAYQEYRQRYVRLDDAGTGSSITHQFGIGEGNGCRLFNLKHATIPTHVVVMKTGQPLVTGTRTINVVTSSTSSTLRVVRGTVNAGTQDGQAPTWASVDIAFVDNRNTDAQVTIDTATVTTLTQEAGQLYARACTTTTFNHRGGTAFVDYSTVTTVTTNGTLYWGGTNTITTLTVDSQGVFDLTRDLSEFTVTNCTVRGSGKIADPYRRATFTNDIIGVGASLVNVNIGNYWTVDVAP